MGSEKRRSDSIDTTSKHAKRKKAKSENGGKARVDSHSVALVYINPMEKKKQKKSVDKERHLAKSEEIEPLKAKSMAEGVDQVTSLTEPYEAAKVPAFHINVFKDLVSADSSVRETAVEALVMELKAVQKAHHKLNRGELDGGDLQLEAEKDDGLTNCAPSLRYAIRRLIRGVSSSRECARQGFALGLAIVVGTIPSIKLVSLLKLINDLLEVTSSMKGQEARECLLGRLFAYGALARSGRIAKEWISDNNTSSVKEFIGLVISLADKKSYLREPAVSIILELVEKLPVEAVLTHVLEAPGIHDWFQRATENGNPDALLLALKLREKISVDNETMGKLLPCPFSPSKLFSHEHLSSLIPCFKESTFCQPRVHSLWPVLVNILFLDAASQEEDASLGHSSKKSKKNRKCNSFEEIAKHLQCFCNVVIEEALLPSSHDRKHLVFDVLLLLLPRLPASCVEIVLSHKLVHCLIDILSTKNSWLYKTAQYFLNELFNWARDDDDRRVAVIVALQKHSSGRFDLITHTVKGLVAEFKTASGCMQFVQSLMSLFVDGGSQSDEPSDQSQTTDEMLETGLMEDKDSDEVLGNPESLKNWVVDCLPRVSKCLRNESEVKFRVQKEILKFLVVQGVFSASLGTEVTSFELQEKLKWPKIVTSSDVCRKCIEQLQMLVADAQKGERLRSEQDGLEANDLGLYFMRFLDTLWNIPSVSLFRTLSKEDEDAFKKLISTEAWLFRMGRNSGRDANKVHAMRYLLIQVLLQLLLRPMEFSEAASELVICCEKAFSAPAITDNFEEEDGFDDCRTPVLMDVLTDTLLSLLPQSSGPLCFAVEQVFRFFCDDITESGLLRMLRLIKKDLGRARHQAAHSDDEDDDDGEDFLGIEEADEMDEAREAENADSGDSEDDAEDSKAALDAEETGRVATGSDDSDGGMDDDAMFRMDSYLARIFKERKNSSGAETAQSQLVLFKLRVLSLLEILLHRNAGKPLVLTVYSYLVRAYVNSHAAVGDRQLAQRIGGIVQKKIFKAKEYPKGCSDIQLSTLESLLQKSLRSAARSRQKAVASLAQNSTFWILKIIHGTFDIHGTSSNIFDSNRVCEIFQPIFLDYFDNRKCRLKLGFVKEIFRRHPLIWQWLFGFLLEKCGDARSEFRRLEVLSLLGDLLRLWVLSKEKGLDLSERKNYVSTHIPSLCSLIHKLLSTPPEKPSRRAEVRRFCIRVLEVAQHLGLKKKFLKALKAQLQDMFLPFEKLIQ